MATSSPPLPDALGRAPGTVTVLLFSQPGCPYCLVAREHYLRPLAAARTRGIVVAEIEISGARIMDDWQGRPRSHAQMASAHGARLAPTVMFLDVQGKALAPAIVGLSSDYFGAYLDERIATATAALRLRGGMAHAGPRS